MPLDVACVGLRPSSVGPVAEQLLAFSNVSINLLKQPALLRVTFLLAVGLLTAFARTGAQLETGARRAGPASARENFGRKTGKRGEPHARLTNGRTMKEEPKFMILNVDDDEASRYAISRILET